VIVVMSGLPGVGKSALADAIGRALGATVLSVDPIETALWQAGIARDQPTGIAAYQVADVLAREQIRLGGIAVVDAVNGVEIARAQWRAIASDFDVPLRIVEVVCSDIDLHRSRVVGRIRDLPGFPELTWADVVAVAATFEPWTEERLTVDSADDLEANISRALGYVGVA
jgi:predicted kinase